MPSKEEIEFLTALFSPARDLPSHWVFPEVAAGFAAMDPKGWPLKPFCGQTQQWVEFSDATELQAETLPASEEAEFLHVQNLPNFAIHYFSPDPSPRCGAHPAMWEGIGNKKTWPKAIERP
jgi:hypothetical protein